MTAACLCGLPDTPFLRVDEVAAYFRVSRSTVYGWIQAGQLPAVRIGGTVRLPRAAVVALGIPSEREG